MTSLAEAYRPRRFADVIGQEGPSWVLQALVQARFPSAVLLAGPSGTGKTSLARIVARALNCETEGPEPCLECPSCRQSLDGTHPAVMEVDSANFASADDVRELVSGIGISHPFKHLCIVMDEAHAMSRQAWDVLLRTLESDPPACSFIFCTTSPDKLRPEVLSRVYRFDLAAPRESLVAERLRAAAEALGHPVSEEVSFEVAGRAHGNVRTALQLLEKVLLHPHADVDAVLGASGFGLRLLEAAISRSRTAGILVLDAAWERYGNSPDIYADWMEALEQLLMVKCETPTTDNPATLLRLRGMAPAFQETMIAAGMEALAAWARRPGRRGSLSFAWTDFLKALNGPTVVEGLATGTSRRQARKMTAADLSTFSI